MSLDILILAIFRLKFLHPHLNFKLFRSYNITCWFGIRRMVKSGLQIVDKRVRKFDMWCAPYRWQNFL